MADYEFCRKKLNSYFNKFPNQGLKTKVNAILENMEELKIPIPGKSGGWAGGILYAAANDCKQPCGVPCLLNKECEDFFGVSMDTIYRRAKIIIN